MDPVKALDEIEYAMKSTSDNSNFPTAAEYYESYWKPRLDAVRAAMITPELKVLPHRD